MSVKESFIGYFNPAYDFKTNTYMKFKSWHSAVVFAQSHKMKLNVFEVVKVEDHYEIH